MALTVTGIFEDESKAQDAQLYLMANGFSDGTPDHNINITDDFTLVNLALRTGNTLTLHLETTREAQEGVDVLNNYGAVTVDIVEA